MAKKKANLLPSSGKLLAVMGENIRMARLRRKLSAEQVAERANITRVTLRNIENGSPSVSMGHYFLVLFVLGLEKDLLKVGADDVLGRKLQDAKISIKDRAPKKARNE